MVREIPPVRWFITDRPITAAWQDRFSHADVADNLHIMINGAGRDERLMIGLLGPFGVGKSTVVQLLSEKVNPRQCVVLRVSAERHEQPGLHASLIYAFAEELVAKANVDRVLVEEELRALTYQSAQTRVDPTATGFAQLPAMARRFAAAKRWVVPAVVTTVAVFIVGAIMVWATLGKGWIAWLLSTVSAAGVVALAAVPASATTALARWAQELVKPGSTTITRPRVQTADEFERTFAALVKLAAEKGKKRLIIAVDDIDRLSSAEVLIGLNAIRSFQLTCDEHQRPVFIVSADEDIIENAIKRSNPGPAAGSAGRGETARAFVDRLFTHRQEMPVHAGADLTAFANSLLAYGHAGAAQLGDKVTDVVEILIHDSVQDPRHVIRLLNAFFGDYRLAWRRETNQGSSHAIRAGIVTDEPLTLARMTVLKLDFPKFHRALFDDDELLRKLERDISGEAGMGLADCLGTGYITQAEFEKRTKADGEAEQDTDDASFERTDWDRLRAFVGRTTRIQPVPDLRPFLYLGQGEIDRIIGGREARNTRDYLINGQTAALRAQLTTIAASEDAEVRLEAVTKVIIDTIYQRVGLERSNAVDTLTRVLDLVPHEGKPELAVCVATALRNGAATPEQTRPLLLLTEVAEQHDKDLLAQRVLDPGGAPTTERDLVVLQGREELSRLLGSDTVRTHLAARLQDLHDADQATIEAWLKQWDSTPAPDLAEAFLTFTLQSLAQSTNDVPDRWRGPMIERFAEAAGQETAERLADDDLLTSANEIIQRGLATVIAAIVIEGLHHLRTRTIDQFDAIYAGILTAPGAEADRITDATWVNTLDVIADVPDSFGDADVGDRAGEIVGTYLTNHMAEPPASEAFELLALITRHSDAAAAPVATTLMDSWTLAATDGSEFPIDSLINNAAPEATDTLAAISAALNAALAPAQVEPLRSAAVSTFAPLSQSEAGHQVLSEIFNAQFAAFRSNGEGLVVIADYLIAIFALPDYTPDSSETRALVDRCRSEAARGQAQQEMLEVLSRIHWPAADIGLAMETIAAYVPQLGNRQQWGILEQLAATAFPVPDPLRASLIEIMIAEGDSDLRKLTTPKAAAHLPVPDTVDVALRLELGPAVIAEMDDAADTGTAMDQAFDTLTNNPDRLGRDLTQRTLIACAEKSPQSWADQLRARADTELGGDRVASYEVWRTLIGATTGLSESTIVELAVRAINNQPASGSEFLSAAIAAKPQVQQACVRLLSDAIGGNDQERVRAIAELLTVTPEAKKLGSEAMYRKRGLAWIAREIVGDTNDD